MKRIALTQRVEQVPGYGEKRDCLDQQWARLLISLGYCPVPLANLVDDVALYVATLQLDGVILTGGNDLCDSEGGSNLAPERDRFEHLLLEVCAERRLPVLGVCRGLQLMNVHYGGSVTPVHNHVNRRHQVSLAQGFLDGGSRSIHVNSFHQFGVCDSGRSSQLKATAWAEDGTIEAMVHKSLPQLAVMWHPEREKSCARRDTLMIQGIFGGGEST